MEWFAQNVTEMLIAVEIGLTAWLVTQVIQLGKTQAVLDTKVEHINKSVNNVGEGEKTLRALVEESHRGGQTQELLMENLRTQIKYLEARTEKRYKSE